MPTERPPPRSRLFGRREAQAASQRRRVPSVRRTLRHFRRVGRVLRQGGAALIMLCFGFVNQIHDVAYHDTESKSIIPKKSFLQRILRSGQRLPSAVRRHRGLFPRPPNVRRHRGGRGSHRSRRSPSKRIVSYFNSLYNRSNIEIDTVISVLHAFYYGLM